MGRITAILGTMVLTIGLFALGPATTVGAQTGTGTGTGTGDGTGTGTGTGTGPGTGTGTGAGDCSHGFFKNHPDFWFGAGCQEFCEGLTDEQLLADLNLRGGGTNKERREFARDCLNECTGCTED